MLVRAKYPKQRDVLVINDVPTRKELELGEKFSSASNLNLLTSLRTGRVNAYASLTSPKDFKGIPAIAIASTYIDYSYYGEEEVDGNFDFNKEIKRKKELKLIHAEGDSTITYYVDRELASLRLKDVDKLTYKELTSQKDIFISVRLFNNLIAILQEIEQIQPKIIIITGKWGLFFLTGCASLAQTIGTVKDRKPLGGLVKFRASMLKLHESLASLTSLVIPIYHTVNAISMLDKVLIMELDMQKLAWIYWNVKESGLEYYNKPTIEPILGTSVGIVVNYLDNLLTKLDKKPCLLSIDIETFFNSVIDCVGITDSTTTGLCIPFATINNPNYWCIEDEILITSKLREVLLHSNARHIGQNYQFDCQYFHKLWLIDPKIEHDTLVLHHILYNYLPKDLAFMASLYCEHYSYWKGEVSATIDTPEIRWIYNVKDVCYTLEVLEVLLSILEKENSSLQDLYRFQIQELYPELISTMNAGIAIDRKQKEELYEYFKAILTIIPEKVNSILGFAFNFNSTPQKKKLFTAFFGMKLHQKRKKGQGYVDTCDAMAMKEYIKEYPLYAPFLSILLEATVLNKFTSTFLGMQLDTDSRARTQYRIAGTAFGRLASTKNVWRRGCNMQNLPEKGKLPIKYILELMGNSVGNEIDMDEFTHSLLSEEEVHEEL